MENDAISRSALLAEIDKQNRGQTVDSLAHIGMIVNDIPALDVAPVVHAYWKKTYDLIDGHDGYECSACGYTKYFDHYAEGIALCNPYCCECGAIMDAKEG